MTTKQKFYITFLYAAMLLSLTHAVVPHHHHGNLICFSPKCVQECHCHHHHDGDEAKHCSCAHHHHETDECTLFAPYILDDGARDISDRISAGNLYGSDLLVAILLEYTFSPLENPTPLHSDFAKAPPLPENDAFATICRRGPPAA